MNSTVARTQINRMLAFLNAIALFVALVPSSAFAAQDGDLEAQASDLPMSGVWGTCPWEIDAGGTLVVHPGEGKDTESYSPWKGYEDIVRRVVFLEENGKKVIAPRDSSSLFVLNSDYTYVNSITEMIGNKIESIDLSGLDTSKVVDISNFFRGCRNLKSVDVSSLDTSIVKEMTGMFFDCSELAQLDVTNFKTGRVTSMGSMFKGCSSLKALDLTHFDTRRVTTMSSMFRGCSSLRGIDISHLDTWGVSVFSGMFADCSSLASLDVSTLNTYSATSMSNMFSGCSSLQALDVSRFDTSHVFLMSNMFADCSSLRYLDLSSFDTSKCDIRNDSYNNPGMQNLFKGCEGLVEIKLGYDFSFKGSSDVIQSTLPDGYWMSKGTEQINTALQVAQNHGKYVDTYVRIESPKIINDVAGTIWIPNSSTLISFYSDAPISLFVEVKVDGKRLDQKNYDLAADVTEVTLTPAYLSSLSMGKHTIDIVSKNGTASSYFSVTDNDGNLPDSNDQDNPTQDEDGKGASSANSQQSTSIKTEVMYRLYNPNSGEHFYTADAGERDAIAASGWTYEGEAWKAPAKSETPVFRLYSGTDHHYTTSAHERDELVKVGWSDEGIGWYSDDAKGIGLHRLFNPHVDPAAAFNNSGSHHYTTSDTERDELVRIGWVYEDFGWHGAK